MVLAIVYGDVIHMGRIEEVSEVMGIPNALILHQALALSETNGRIVEAIVNVLVTFGMDVLHETLDAVDRAFVAVNVVQGIDIHVGIVRIADVIPIRNVQVHVLEGKGVGILIRHSVVITKKAFRGNVNEEDKGIVI